ncbi:MAG: hypothetical protein ABSH34_24865 [Verrucomicrobiota bacterium]|jgi:hypothetical protein
MKLLILLFSALLAWASWGEDTNVVFSDDFETPSLQSPPSGWAMWGAEEFKVPANYTRDTTQPHGGQACFRIHHPANTGGYVVSAPNRAIYLVIANGSWTPSHCYVQDCETSSPELDAPGAGRDGFACVDGG